MLSSFVLEKLLNPWVESVLSQTLPCILVMAAITCLVNMGTGWGCFLVGHMQHVSPLSNKDPIALRSGAMPPQRKHGYSATLTMRMHGRLRHCCRWLCSPYYIQSPGQKPRTSSTWSRKLNSKIGSRIVVHDTSSSSGLGRKMFAPAK